MPDSDDDAIVDDDDDMEEHEKKPKPMESSLSKWIKHLSELMKEEQRKVYHTCISVNLTH